MKLYFTLWANLCFENFSAGNSGHDEKVTVLELVSLFNSLSSNIIHKTEMTRAVLLQKREWLSCVGRTGVEAGPGVEYPGTVARGEAGHISEQKTISPGSLFFLYLPCTVGKSVEQVLILHIQVLNKTGFDFISLNFAIYHWFLVLIMDECILEIFNDKNKGRYYKHI